MENAENEESGSRESFHVELISTSGYQMALSFIKTNHPDNVVLFAINTPWLEQVLTGENDSKIKPDSEEFLHKMKMDFERYPPEFFFLVVDSAENARFLREIILKQLSQEVRDKTDLNMHIYDKGEVLFI